MSLLLFLERGAAELGRESTEGLGRRVCEAGLVSEGLEATLRGAGTGPALEVVAGDVRIWSREADGRRRGFLISLTKLSLEAVLRSDAEAAVDGADAEDLGVGSFDCGRGMTPGLVD